MWTILVTAIWLVCFLLTYGGALAYFQGEYSAAMGPTKARDRLECCVYSLLGPVSLLMLLSLWKLNEVRMFKHGLKFW